jgi:hypothetical protein
MEHRRSQRTRTILQGRVVLNNRFSLLECIVRDLSNTGAQIAFAHPVTLPSEVELEIPKRRLSVRAKVMWSDGKSHGLMFLGGAQERAHQGSPAPSAEPEHVNTSSLQEVDADGSSPSIQAVLEEARTRIAHIAGVSAETVRLRLEIDF